MEKWVNLKYVGFEHYEVSNIGRLRKGNYIMKDRIGSRGYKIIGLRLKADEHKKQKMFLMHRVVAEHFLEKTPGKDYVNHIDLDKTNNVVNNLEWVTPLENVRHAMENGRFAYWSTDGKRVKKEKKEAKDRRIKVRVVNDKLGIDETFESIAELLKRDFNKCNSMRTIKRLLNKEAKSRFGYELHYV